MENLLKTIQRITVLIFLIYIFSSCANDTPTILDTGTVRGYVYETGSTTAVSDVRVSIGGKSYTTTTNGFYELKDVITGSNTAISAIATGYVDYYGTVDVRTGINEHNLYLSKAFTNLYGYVKNSLDQGIQNALVEISGFKQYTDNNGYYMFSAIPQGKSILEVISTGYQSFSQTLYLAHSDYSYNLQLSAKIFDPPQPQAELTAENEITISWTALNSITLKGYFIYRSVNGGEYQKINSTPLLPLVSTYKEQNLAIPSSQT